MLTPLLLRRRLMPPRPRPPLRFPRCTFMTQHIRRNMVNYRACTDH